MPNETTPLYQEAVLEVKKLREVARKEAEKSIIEELNPLITKMIDREMDGSFLFEQDEPVEPDPLQDLTAQQAAPSAAANPIMPATSPMDSPVVPPTDSMGTSSMPAGAGMPPTDSSVPAPSPATDAPPVSTGAEMNIPVPGPDGKITVDIESLFAATPEGSEPNFAAATVTPAAPEVVPPVATDMPVPGPETAPGAPAPLAPEFAPEPLAEALRSSLRALEKEINSDNHSSIIKEMQQNKLFILYEFVQKAKESKEISAKVLKSVESTLEVLFSLTRKTLNERNSYSSKSLKKENSEMAKKNYRSLQEFAQSLFAEEVEAKGASGFDDAHAKTDINNSTTLKDETPMKKSGDGGGVEDPGKKDSLNLQEGDEDMEAELMEMLQSMDEETSIEEKGSSMKKESLQKKLKALKEEQTKLTAALKECDMSEETSEEPVMADADNVNIKITLGKNASGKTAVQDVSMVSPVGDEDDDSHAEMSADSDESEASDDSDDDDTFEIVADDEDEESDDSDKDSDAMTMVSESKVSKDNKKIRAELKETQLLAARSIYVSKIFAENNLSTKTKQKIVEYLDNAQNVEEAKSLFEKAKKMLAEAKKVSPKTGASSRASEKPVLREAVQPSSPYMAQTIEPNRWMQLAGIGKKKSA